MFYLSLVDGAAGVAVGDIALTTVADGADGQAVDSQEWVAARVVRVLEELVQVLEVQVRVLDQVQEQEERVQVLVRVLDLVQEAQAQEQAQALEERVAVLLPQDHKV